MREVFEYTFTRLDPVAGAHIDPPSVAIYETLLRKGENETPLPGLAETWVTSPDGLICRVALRKGAVFHSGRPCDAPAVVAALERCRFGDAGLRQLWYWDPMDTIEVIDPSTIEIRLRFPYRRLPTLLWGTHTSIYNDEARQRLGDAYGAMEADGTGRFRLLGFDGQHVEAERVRPSGGEGPNVERIEWLSVPQEHERASVLEEATADVVRAPPFDLLDDLREDPRWRVAEVPEPSQLYLALDFEHRQFDFHRREMRAALEAAVDREALVDAAFMGHGDGRRSPVPTGDPFASSWDPAVAKAMGLEEAGSVLDAIGWTRDGSGVRAKDGTKLAFECIIQESPVFRRLAAELGVQLGMLGVDVSFVYVEPFEPFYSACDARRPASFLNKWLWQDSIEAVMGFTQSSCACDGSPNWQSSKIPTLDAAYDTFLRSTTDQEASDAAAQVQEIFMRELPYIPLCSPTEVMAIGSHVDGFGPISGTLYPYYESASLR